MAGKAYNKTKKQESVSVPAPPVLRPEIIDAYLAVTDDSRFKGPDWVEKDTVNLLRINDFAVSSQIYIVVQTKNFIDKANRKIKVKFKQLETIIPAIPDKVLKIGEGFPDAIKKYRKKDAGANDYSVFKNLKDFNDYAIGAININKSHRKLIADSENHIVEIILEVDAHTINPGFKGIEARIDYKGKKFKESKFSNFYCTENENINKLRAWKGIVVHSMCDLLDIPKDIEKKDKKGNVIKTIKKGIHNHKNWLLEDGLSVHGFIHENGEFEGMQDLYSKAGHAGPSFYEGISDLNNSYLGYEMILSNATTFEYFKLLCHGSQADRDKKKNKLEAAIKKLETERGQIISKIKNKVNVKYKTEALKQARIALIDEEVKINNNNIELLNHKAYPQAQFDAAVKKTKEWMEMFAIPVEYVVRHSDISNAVIKSGPKWDPGNNFDWKKFKEKLVEKAAPKPVLHKTITLPTHPINL